MTGDQEHDVSGLEPEAIAEMIELAEDYLSVDELLVELRERAGTRVVMSLGVGDPPKVILETRGVLRFDAGAVVEVGSTTFALWPPVCLGGFWMNDDPQRPALYLRFSGAQLMFDFNAPEGD